MASEEVRLGRSLTRNVIVNLVAAVTNALGGLVTAAFLVRAMGLELFGLWALVVGATSLLWLLDLGITTAVGRLVAAQRASDDMTGINQIFSTAIAMLWGCALAIAVVSLFLPGLFFVFFAVRAAEVQDVTVALWLMGLASSVHFIAAPFTCTLWGYERLDLAGLIETPMIVLRLALLFTFVGSGSPIWIVAACTLLAGCLGAIAQAIATFRVEPRLRPRPLLVTRSAASRILWLGLDFAAVNAARSVAAQFSPFVIGYALDNASVGVFAVARQLSANCNALVSAATEAIAARSVRLFHSDATSSQVVLFVEGGRYTTTLSVLLTSGLVLLGDSFVHLWQGGRADSSYPQLCILAVGEFLALSQWVTYWVIAGIRKQRLFSAFAIGETLTIAGVSLLLVYPWGLTGVSIATALAAALCRGIAPLIYGCRVLNVKLAAYSGRVILPNIVVGLGAAVVGNALDQWIDPRTWPSFLLTGFLYTVVFALCAASLWCVDSRSARSKSISVHPPR